jgi:hypothetical protein
MDPDKRKFWKSEAWKKLNRAKTPILIDFFPGQSGHFISYAINLCVFDLDPGQDIFTDIGTINTWKFGNEYIDNMQCFAAHWSDQDLEILVPQNCTVVRVITNSHVSQLISVINLVLRAGDRSYTPCGELSDRELIRTLWHIFINFSVPDWKQPPGKSQYLDFSMLCNKTKFQQWMQTVSMQHGQGSKLKNLRTFDEMYDYYWQKNHGVNIWKESGAILEAHANDTVIRHFLTPFHDFAVFYRMISALQLRISTNDVSDLIQECINCNLDFQVARRVYCEYNS